MVSIKKNTKNPTNKKQKRQNAKEPPFVRYNLFANRTSKTEKYLEKKKKFAKQQFVTLKTRRKIKKCPFLFRRTLSVSNKTSFLNTTNAPFFFVHLSKNPIESKKKKKKKEEKKGGNGSGWDLRS